MYSIKLLKFYELSWLDMLFDYYYNDIVSLQLSTFSTP